MVSTARFFWTSKRLSDRAPDGFSLSAVQFRAIRCRYPETTGDRGADDDGRAPLREAVVAAVSMSARSRQLF